MKQNIGVKITGTGSYLPSKILSNKELEEIVDTTDQWIRSRTGIEQRHIAAENEPTSALGAKAAEKALEAAMLEAKDIDAIIVATITPDKIFPNTACFVQEQIKAKSAACFSVEAACSGFVYILAIGASLIQSGLYKKILLIGAEKLSSIINWNDRNTCVLFGDGAGAAVIEKSSSEENMYINSNLGSDGNHSDILHVPAGGSRIPFSPETSDKNLHYLAMSGPEVFKLAITTMVATAKKTLQAHNISIEQIRWLIPHQANTRILSSVAKKLGIPENKVYVNLQYYGNTSAASIPIALDEMVKKGSIRQGDYLLLVAFGGGLTWGSSLIRW